MPTRRAIVLGTIATGIAVRTGRVLAKASQLATPVNFDVPAGACDCHTHIFGAASGIGRATALIFTREGAPMSFAPISTTKCDCNFRPGRVPVQLCGRRHPARQISRD